MNEMRLNEMHPLVEVLRAAYRLIETVEGITATMEHGSLRHALPGTD